MNRFVLVSMLAFSIVGVAASQTAPDAGLRDAIVVMRAMNTAENAARRQGGKYVPLATLVDHGFMKGVRPNIVVNGDTITHLDAPIRLVLSGDAMQYQVMVMPRESCGVAVFSDERGVIYTGKGLGC